MKKKARPGVTMNKRFITILCGLFFIYSCTEPEAPKKEVVKKPTLPVIPAPQFNSDSAYSYIEQQVAFGPRVPNSAAHDSCAAYLKRKFRSFGMEVTSQKGVVEGWDGVQLNFENIMASINPEATSKVLLLAHWDTRPFADQEDVLKTSPLDGASDGGSGVAVLMEIGRLISITKPNIGVDIVLFDVEDYGKSKIMHSYCLGSQYWSRNLPDKNYYPKYGILLDMVGARNATFAMEGYSMQFAPHIVNRIWKKAAALGYSNYFIFKRTNPTTDDHYYVNSIAGIPCIDIIQHDATTTTGFGSYWHTTKDNMEVIDKATLKAVGQTVLEVLYSEK
ncbi:MAG: M28 family peptidase [Flavobacteriales bacterium]|nr:M28 family peptidase [Flavobacteriales bacterium]